MKKIFLIFLLLPLFFLYGADSNSFPLTFGPFFIFPTNSINHDKKNTHKEFIAEKEKYINIIIKNEDSKKQVCEEDKKEKKKNEIGTNTALISAR